MEMLYALSDASTGPFVETDHIFGIAVADGQEIAKLPLAGCLIGQLIGGLYIDNKVATTCYEINLTTSGLLAGKHLEAAM